MAGDSLRSTPHRGPEEKGKKKGEGAVDERKKEAEIKRNRFEFDRKTPYSCTWSFAPRESHLSPWQCASETAGTR